jgi:TolA-binding protein|tara:strand:- start:746 stop:1057 length:312 start_codon:yes stop_codon:yes gene_type:complete
MEMSLTDLEASESIQMAKTPPAKKFTSSTCQFMLRMAQAHLAKNELRLATDVFMRVIKEYPNSEERNEAQDSLLTMARHYETEGQFRVALDLLEKIDQVAANG